MALGGVSSVDAVYGNACAVAEGIAYCWGSPLSSAGSPPSRALPEPVLTPEPVVQISTTDGRGNTFDPQRACAVGITGAVFCWGANQAGQAGDGTKTYAVAPVKVAGLPGLAAEVKTTPRTTCALLTTGQVYCWGDDAHGQLGRGQAFVPSVVPQEVVLP